MSTSQRSPLRIAAGLLEHVVFALQVHDAVLEVELPLISASRHLVVLTDDHVLRIEYFGRILIAHIVLAVQRLLFFAGLLDLIVVLVVLIVLVIVVVVVVIVLFRTVRSV